MFLPSMGTFVVISIDPIATLDCAENKEMSEICKGLTNKKYVAYVDKSNPYLFNPHVRYHSYELYLLFQGLPSGNLAEYQEPEMSIPVMPNNSHPTSRHSIEPLKPLPWDNCYLSIFCAIEARCAAVSIPRERRDYKLPCLEMVFMREMLSTDVGRRKELFLAQNPGQKVPILHVAPRSPGLVSEGSEAAESLHSGSESEESDEEESGAEDTESDEEYSGVEDTASEEVSSEEGSESDSDTSDTDSEPDGCAGAIMQAMLGSGTQSDMTPVFIASNDLASLDKLNDPKEFFQEVELLKKLREDFKAIRLREIQKTRELDDEHFNQQASFPTPSLPQETVISPHPDTPQARNTVNVQTSSTTSIIPQETVASLQTPHTHTYKDTANVQMESPTSSQLQGPEQILSPLTRIQTRKDVDAPKGLTMGRLCRKAGDAIQNIAPRKLLATFSAIRRNGNQHLSWALHRLKSARKAKSSSPGSTA